MGGFNKGLKCDFDLNRKCEFLGDKLLYGDCLYFGECKFFSSEGGECLFGSIGSGEWVMCLRRNRNI